MAQPGRPTRMPHLLPLTKSFSVGLPPHDVWLVLWPRLMQNQDPSNSTLPSTRGFARFKMPSIGKAPMGMKEVHSCWLLGPCCMVLVPFLFTNTCVLALLSIRCTYAFAKQLPADYCKARAAFLSEPPFDSWMCKPVSMRLFGGDGAVPGAAVPAGKAG